MNNLHIFNAASPYETHWEAASCEDVDCPQYLLGWRTLVDESTDLGQAQAHYIRTDATRAHTEERDAEGLTVFTFQAGQTCFREHKAKTDRPEILTHDNRVHVRPADWQEDMNETVYPIVRLIEGG